MILDGYWKWDLKRIKHSLRFWSSIRFRFFRDYAEHRVNRSLLLSAVIIRKIVEDEREAEDVCKTTNALPPPLPVIKINVPINRINHIDERKLFANSCVFLQDYDTENVVKEEVPLSFVCNQIIHSYAWALVYLNGRKIYEVLFASDIKKEKEIYALVIRDWADVVQKVIDKANV